MERPQELKEHKFKVEVSHSRELVWAEGRQKDHIQPSQLGDRIMQIWFGLVSRANQGKATGCPSAFHERHCLGTWRSKPSPVAAAMHTPLPRWVIHVIPAVPACPVCPESGAFFGPRGRRGLPFPDSSRRERVGLLPRRFVDHGGGADKPVSVRVWKNPGHASELCFPTRQQVRESHPPFTAATGKIGGSCCTSHCRKV
jgi:hypothetical protein